MLGVDWGLVLLCFAMSLSACTQVLWAIPLSMSFLEKWYATNFAQ